MLDEPQWTEAKVNRLRLLWAQGVSMQQIADELGVSKNAIAGKRHRLGLQERPSPIVHAGEPKPVSLHGLRVAFNIAVASAMPSQVSAETAARFACQPSPGAPGGRCQFPLWASDEKPNHTYCNSRVRRANSPYCEAHRVRVFQGA
jgi:hypothetical protein